MPEETGLTQELARELDVMIMPTIPMSHWKAAFSLEPQIRKYSASHPRVSENTAREALASAFALRLRKAKSDQLLS